MHGLALRASSLGFWNWGRLHVKLAGACRHLRTPWSTGYGHFLYLGARPKLDHCKKTTISSCTNGSEIPYFQNKSEVETKKKLHVC
jgi:hypothetical protein